MEKKQLRSFGLIVGSIFVLVSIWPPLIHGEGPRLWALVIGGGLLIPALVAPLSLRLVYRGWMAVGHAVGWVNTRILLSIILYGLITPIGLFRRFVLGKDSMRRKFEPELESYRIMRQPRDSSHMKRQF